MTTIAELDAQVAELNRQRDLISLAGTKAVQAALVVGNVATLADDLEALLPSLSSDSITAQMTRNVINVVRNTRSLVDGEVARIEALTAEPSGAGSPDGGELQPA